MLHPNPSIEKTTKESHQHLDESQSNKETTLQENSQTIPVNNSSNRQFDSLNDFNMMSKEETLKSGQDNALSGGDIN